MLFIFLCSTYPELSFLSCSSSSSGFGPSAPASAVDEPSSASALRGATSSLPPPSFPSGSRSSLIWVDSAFSSCAKTGYTHGEIEIKPKSGLSQPRESWLSAPCTAQLVLWRRVPSRAVLPAPESWRTRQLLLRLPPTSPLPWHSASKGGPS